MNFKGIRVLVLEGYARQSLPLIRAFKNLGCEVTALCSSKLDVAYVSRYTDHKVIGVCDRDNINDTTVFIRGMLKSGKYDVIVPSVDFSAAILSENKEEFSKYVKVLSNDLSVFEIAADKHETMAICMKNGIPCPITVLDANTIEQVLTSGIKFPIAVKPRIGYGAIGFKKVNSPEELTGLFPENFNTKNYIFQEYIPQTDLQYECAMFVDNNFEVKTSVVFSKNRWFPISGGSSTLNITVDRPDIVESCKKLLNIINWHGAADIDLIHDPRDNTAKIMEINPRVSGSVKLVFESGVDQAKQMLQLAYDVPVEEYKTYSIGNRLRCMQTDFLWFLVSSNRFKTKPSWFSFKSTKDHTFYPDDPLPWLAFSLNGIGRIKKELQKRK